LKYIMTYWWIQRNIIDQSSIDTKSDDQLAKEYPVQYPLTNKWIKISPKSTKYQTPMEGER
jgi:hypothetical protein